jgi:hypothetical protein
MGINAVAATQAVSIMPTTNTNDALASTTGATFQSTLQQAKTKLSLSEFYAHGDQSRLTDTERSELKQAIELGDKVNKGDTSFTDAKSYQTKYDLDHDGVVTTQELDTHIAELQDKRSSNFIGVNQELHFGLLLKSHYTHGSAMFKPEDIHTAEGSMEAVAQRQGAAASGWSSASNTIYATILNKYSDLFF